MEIFPIGSLTLLLGGSLVFGACVFGLHLMYLRGTRRYKQFLNDSYAENFAQKGAHGEISPRETGPDDPTQ